MHMKKSDANDEESGYPMVDTMDSIGSSLGVETDRMTTPKCSGTRFFLSIKFGKFTPSTHDVKQLFHFQLIFFVDGVNLFPFEKVMLSSL